ncbi:MAG: hypothetical protein NT175_06235 [Bacteroidetes bacterium]|nr:hypothetical protein [Bacteroidota bacterium]
MKLINRYITIIIPVLCLLYSVKVNWGEGQWPRLIQSDGKGYYAWLPAFFIYHDLNFGFYEKTELQNSYDKNRIFDYRIFHEGHTLNKFTCGTALCLLPFFLAAHLLTIIFGYPADGYSQFYAIFVNIGALFYLFVGLYYLKRILESLKFEAGIISLILTAIVFGTNLFYYVIGEPSMSHLYSFAAITLFIYSLKSYFRSPSSKWLFFIAITLGIIVLIRPVNTIIAASIPFIAGDGERLKNAIRYGLSNLKALIPSVLVFLSVIFIQLVLFKIQSDEFLVYTYPGEKFNFAHPHILEILFSYKKGLFLYTPVFLISMCGFIWLFRKNRFEGWSLLGFFALLIYIFSSWWNWWYGGGFSSRVFVDYLPFFSILLGYSFNLFMTRKIRVIFITLIFLLIMLCQVQTLQYRYLHIHWEEMTKEKYWDSFLRIDRILKEKSDSKTN